MTASTARHSMFRRFRSSAEYFCAWIKFVDTSAITKNRMIRFMVVFAKSSIGSFCYSVTAGLIETLLHLFHDLIDAETGWPLTGRIILKGGEELGDYGLA